MTVLITGYSGLSKYVTYYLKNNEDNENVVVIGTNSDEKKLLKNVADFTYIVPPINDEKYLQTMLDICKKHKVDIFMPYITAELNILPNHIKEFNDIGTIISISSKESLKIANDKINLYSEYKDLMPKEFVVKTVDEVFKALNELKYPTNKICCKIADKCGGTGFCVLDEDKATDISLFNRKGFKRYINISQLVDIVKSKDCEIIMQEYVEGNDYTVCALADKGNIKRMVGIEGYEMEYGCILKGMIKKYDKAYEIVTKVTKELNLDGNLGFDFMVTNDGDCKLLEVNPRLSGSIPFACKAGVNLPYLRCKLLLGKNIEDDYEVKYGLRMEKVYEPKYF